MIISRIVRHSVRLIRSASSVTFTMAPVSFDFDLVVIGGGSGGLAASKEAASLGQKVALLDFVVPSPIGTSWGLGGTCVNVGCIPKKLMHQAALIGELMKDSFLYGWESKDGQQLELTQNINHEWNRMREDVQNVVKGSNFTYRVALRNSGVEYINAYGSFEDKHKLKLVKKDGSESFLTAKNFLIATGERPKYPEIPGAKEFGITSDDLFSLPYCPGKTLVIGASYVALECAGFLRGIGLDVTVMVRSILLRGFDQEMAEKVGEFMAEDVGVKFIRPCVPVSIEQIKPGNPGKLLVKAKMGDGKIVQEEYNTVLFAIGRKPCTDKIGLDKVGVKTDSNGKIPCVNDQTNVSNIYAVGDIVKGRPELTPAAIKAGLYLAKRLAGKSDENYDSTHVPTTIFTPLEYSCVGLSEEDAVKAYGADNIEVYHQHFTPTEWTVAQRPKNKCYVKAICLIPEKERIIGLHYLGPNAGEVMQGFALALINGNSKSVLDRCLTGIHPTTAETFVYLTVTKRSGKSSLQAGCCG